ncbi:LLM class flavin-dependent oxidoreductase [Caldalkalibacillus salinus]|uniref:LLM class flavin-dependent oxidoreductase n=1 Tax=Caldalkalibacillus salinus TaxID=2803787 RepID=UPI001920EF24|nr:LLM class flavin-dependent oxidoreductase [Caldalkalibacillus salinus]
MTEKGQEHHKALKDIKLSVLDLSPIVQESTAKQALHNTIDLAQHVEKLGFERFWLAEHHNMPGIASAATSVLIGQVASNTDKIRVGSGGVMLPNHAPLMVAEQFGTLETLFPGRIDLGLGRAPGTDQQTVQALRRGLRTGGEDFPELLEELRKFFRAPEPGEKRVRAIPGEGLNIPIWLLGSSGFSAQLAAKLGLPFAFASHFAPDHLLAALDLYRRQFQPSKVLDEPYAMAGVNVIAADTDDQARMLATSQELQFLNLIRGRPQPLDPPVDVEEMETIWHPHEKQVVKQQLQASVVGDKQRVREELEEFLRVTQVDELIVNTHVYEHQERVRSYEIVAEVHQDVSRQDY